MPLTINVGLSRKASHNFQSVGASINLTAELDQALLDRPAELHTAVGRLYDHANMLLERRLGPPGHVQHESERAPLSRGAPARNGRDARPATASQRRLISELTSVLGLDVDQVIGEKCGTTPRELTLREASRVIDHLRAVERAG